VLTPVSCCRRFFGPGGPCLFLRRYHSKALLVTFDSDNTSGSHVDVLTREVQEGFKRLDGEIRSMGTADRAGDDDAQVGFVLWSTLPRLARRLITQVQQSWHRHRL
jgi:hypothetical protein